MIVKTAENVYHFVKQSIKIKEEIENAGVKNKTSTRKNTLKIDPKSNLVKYNLDYSKFENCIKQVEEEEKAEKEEEKINKHNKNSCSHDHSKERQLYEKKTAEKLRASNAFNEEGKHAFHEKNYKLACVFFRKGLIQLDYCFPETEAETQEHTKLEINLHLNMALTEFHMEKYYDCINDCTTVLNLDKNNAKAYYRIGHAYMSLDLYKKAKEHFLKAMELSPNDTNIKKSLLTLKRKVEMYNKKNKWVCSKIFSTKADENREPNIKKFSNERKQTDRNMADANTSAEENKQTCEEKVTAEEDTKAVPSKTFQCNEKDEFVTLEKLKTKEKDEFGQLYTSSVRNRTTFKTTENKFTEKSAERCNSKIILFFQKNVRFLYFVVCFLIIFFLCFFYNI